MGNGLGYTGFAGYHLLGRSDGRTACLQLLQSARVLLAATTVIATILILAAILTGNLWVLVSVGLCHSVMWSCIFTLAVKGLGQYTSKASGVFMMGVFGGAVFPVLQGVLADLWGSWQWTWVIAIVCELVMLYYALIGSNVRDEECITA